MQKWFSEQDQRYVLNALSAESVRAHKNVRKVSLLLQSLAVQRLNHLYRVLPWNRTEEIAVTDMRKANLNLSFLGGSNISRYVLYR